MSPTSPIPYPTTHDDHIGAVRHVVYEYANLISSAHYSMKGEAPWRTHCDDAFLLGCRKMDDFLTRKTRSLNYERTKEVDDILALDYLPTGSTITWELPIWTDNWKRHMNKQLAHLSYKRDKEWKHHEWIPRLRPEFEKAWSQFMTAIVDQDYRDEFAKQLHDKRKLINRPPS